MLTLKPHFIIIDDNKLDCFIADKIITNKDEYSSIRSFTEANKALEYIENLPVGTDGRQTIIIVDIQMPVMNGFEFVEAFEKLSLDIKSAYSIFMISSSDNESDRNRMRNYPSVKQLLSKPLNKEALADILDRL